MSTKAKAATSALQRLRDHQAANPSRKGPQCRVCGLPPDLRDAVNAALKEGMQQTAISRWLAAEGHRVGHNAVGEHYRNHVRDGK